MTPLSRSAASRLIAGSFFAATAFLAAVCVPEARAQTSVGFSISSGGHHHACSRVGFSVVETFPSYYPAYPVYRPYCPPPIYGHRVYATPVYTAPVYAAPVIIEAPAYAAPIYEGRVVPAPAARIAADEGNPQVARVQAALRKRGYYQGQVDGLNGPATQAAIRTYQVDRGLPVTGRIDRELTNDLEQ